MIDLLRKTAAVGVGATLIAGDRLEKLLQELVEKGRLSEQEAREAFDKVSSESREEYKSFEDKLRDRFMDFLGDANVATSRDIAALEKRILSLESQIAAMEAEASKDNV